MENGVFSVDVSPLISKRKYYWSFWKAAFCTRTAFLHQMRIFNGFLIASLRKEADITAVE